MKKTVLFTLFTICSIACFAQADSTSTGTGSEIDITGFFGSLTAIAGLVTILTGYINTHANVTGSIAGLSIKQLVSWVVAIGLAFLGQVKGIGIFAQVSTIWTIVEGLAIGIVANGIFSIDLVNSLLVFLKAGKAKV